ncbi:MAG: PaaI family thioesterase [Gemmatimonadetes bacterium]|nr:PaaI family thioesterase [Gemmatimonadota bacterium]
MAEKCLQEEYAPEMVCWGCGPANPEGLRLRSFAGPPEGGKGPDGAPEVVAEWTPGLNHHAFPGVLNGGIIGTLLDCHANWTAAHWLMLQAGATEPPVTVTAEYSVRLLAPTPTDAPVRLTARAVDSGPRRAEIDAELHSGGKVTATCRGVFVAVRQAHPAYHGR